MFIVIMFLPSQYIAERAQSATHEEALVGLTLLDWEDMNGKSSETDGEAVSIATASPLYTASSLPVTLFLTLLLGLT